MSSITRTYFKDIMRTGNGTIFSGSNQEVPKRADYVSGQCKQ